MQKIKSLIIAVGVFLFRQFDRLLTYSRIAPADLGPHVKVGRHTYGIYKHNVALAPSANPPSLTVGNFCSIAPGVMFLVNADHALDLPSTFPFRTHLFYSTKDWEKARCRNADVISRGPIEIGHDVWIGQNTMVLSGVTIGTGAVIGGSSVVTKNIPPYAIAVGNPARVLKHRFSPELIEKLLQSEWWLLSDHDLRRLDRQLYSKDIEAFLQAVEAIKGKS